MSARFLTHLQSVQALLAMAQGPLPECGQPEQTQQMPPEVPVAEPQAAHAPLPTDQPAAWHPSTRADGGHQ